MPKKLVMPYVITKVCAVVAPILKEYCEMSNRDQITEDLVNSVRESAVIVIIALRVRARVVAFPQSVISGSFPFDGSQGFNFKVDDGLSCPVVTFTNRSLGDVDIPVTGGGSVHFPPVTLYFSVGGLPVVTVPFNGSRRVALRFVSNNDSIDMTGTSFFAKTIYNPDGTFTGWCPALNVPAPFSVVSTISGRTDRVHSLYESGNPICYNGDGSFSIATISHD